MKENKMKELLNNIKSYLIDKYHDIFFDKNEYKFLGKTEYEVKTGWLITFIFAILIAGFFLIACLLMWYEESTWQSNKERNNVEVVQCENNTTYEAYYVSINSDYIRLVDKNHKQIYVVDTGCTINETNPEN